MRTAYAGAEAFLRPEPAMPMPDLVRAVAVPPIAQTGTVRRAELARRLRLAPGARVVLVGLGGVPHALPVADWPVVPGVHWLLPDAWPCARADMHPFAASGMAYADMLASADALRTKPSYGSFVEAACAGVPVLYLPRPDWPESPFLTDWLQARVACLAIDEARLIRGDLADPLAALWGQPSRAPVRATGADVAARILLDVAACA